MLGKFYYVSRLLRKGERVGKLTVEKSHNYLRHFWLARCECGRVVAVSAAELNHPGRHACPGCKARNNMMAKQRINKRKYATKSNAPHWRIGSSEEICKVLDAARTSVHARVVGSRGGNWQSNR